MNLASSGAGILAINRAGMWRQTSTTALYNHWGGGGPRPLNVWRFPKINSDQLNMEALSCDMWDPEYSDSELSGKSRDEIGPYTRANSAGGAPRRVTKDNKCCWNYPNGRRHPDLCRIIPCCRLVNYRVISSVENEFLIGISCFVILQPAMSTN